LYEERVLEEIELNIEPAAKENRKTRNFNIRMDILEDMAKKYRQGTVYESITDKDEVGKLDLGIQSEGKHSDRLHLIVFDCPNKTELYTFFSEYLNFVLNKFISAKSKKNFIS
jgi:hypothetical protein